MICRLLIFNTKEIEAVDTQATSPRVQGESRGGSTERSDQQIWPARNYEHRSGQPVHVFCLDRSPAPIRRSHLNGWQGPFLRQRLCRTPVAIPEIRMHITARRGDRLRDQARDQKMDGVLQPQTPTFRPCGKPPAVVNWQNIETINPVQQGQRAA